MIKTNKRLYYIYFDLERISSFLQDESVNIRANRNLSIIDSLLDVDIISLSKECLASIGFCHISIEEIYEFKGKGEIKFVKEYKQKIDDWLLPLLLPNFLDVYLISNIIKKEKIESKKHLLSYMQSQLAIETLGRDYAELNAYFIENMDGENFPMKYRRKYSSIDPLLMHVNGCPIKGNFHNHTLYSDGICSLYDLKLLGKDSNREYVGVSDHTKRVQGVDEKNLHKQHVEISELNTSACPVLLKGLECEILPNGDLDMSEECLKECDYVIAAVHRDVYMTKQEANRRIISAIESPYTKILAHPSAYLYRKNIGLYLDMRKIIDACSANNVSIEINGDADRLDLHPQYIDYALNKGILFTLDSDTHSVDGFKSINNSIKIAEDYKIPPEKILNTYSLDQLKTIWR